MGFTRLPKEFQARKDLKPWSVLVTSSLFRPDLVMSLLWRSDYEKPMRTGHKQGEMRLNCFHL
jgi:hypothetical protein